MTDEQLNDIKATTSDIWHVDPQKKRFNINASNGPINIDMPRGWSIQLVPSELRNQSEQSQREAIAKIKVLEDENVALRKTLAEEEASMLQKTLDAQKKIIEANHNRYAWSDSFNHVIVRMSGIQHGMDVVSALRLKKELSAAIDKAIKYSVTPCQKK